MFFRQARRGTATNCDVYYIPPQDGRYRTREAKRKRRSKKDQERYFEDFPDDDLAIKNFNYVKKPRGMNNAAYEVVQQANLQDACKLFLFFFRISSLTPKTWEHVLQLKIKFVKCKFFHF